MNPATPTESEKKPRTYSATKRAAENGKENREAERIDRELRARIAAEFGEPGTLNRSGVMTQLNAAYFAGLYAAKNHVIFDEGEQLLYAYNAERGIWRDETWDTNLKHITKFTLSEGRRDGCEDILAKKSLKLDREIQTYLRGIAAKRDVFLKDPYASERLIHLRNGVYVVRENKMDGFRSNFRKEDYSRNQIPIDFREEADCPRLINELLRPVLPPETADEDIDLFFRYMGICLLGYNLSHRMLILDGAAGAGKSTLAKLIRLVVGGDENAANLRTHLLADRFELMAFIGKTLLTGVDVKQKFLLTAGAEVLKSLVGGDRLEAEAKQGNRRIPFSGTLNAVITSNAQLRIKLEDDDDAWRRRLIVINFLPYKPARKIDSFEHVLFQEEGSGIVNRALRGLQEVLEAGGEMPMSPAQIKRVDDMLERSDPLGEFLRDRVVKREGGSLAKKRLRSGFEEYCKSRRWNHPGSEVGGKLPELMKEIFGVSESNSIRDPDNHDKDVVGYRGVDWSND